MTGTTAASCFMAWNIVIVDYPSSNCLAGAYQAAEDPSLTWKNFFDDLLLCFNLEPYMTGPPLALYLLQSEYVLAHNLNTPMIYYNSNLPGSEQILSQIIKLTTLVGSEGFLRVAVINHDFTHCKESDTELASHLKSGCAKAVILKRNLNVEYLPIPSGGRPLKPGTPKSPTSPSPAKRSLQLTVPPELETSVKELFNGTCVITRFDSSWRTQITGPGIETCHIFPKALSDWWGYPDSSLSTQEKWNIVNSPDNCMTMEAFSHCIHDSRFLAIHPVSHKIRLFAPIKPLEGRNNKLAYFPLCNLVDNCFLKWHYEQTIIENMWAPLLLHEGWAKRTRSSLAVSETYNEDEFAANLYIRLYEEARYQESLED